MSENPFKYGEIVGGSLFCNRQKELKRLHQAFKDGQNIILISPRRWGKSSLVNQAIATHKTKLIPVTFDCFGIKSVDDFFQKYLKACLRATGSKVSQALDQVGDYVAGMSSFLSFSASEAGEMKIGVSLPKDFKDFSMILDIPNKMAKKKGLPVVVCVDEFQKLNEIQGGKELLELLRSVWQKHTNVCYCLYGSKRHLMNLLFNANGQPFYRFGETIFLDKISADEWVTFIKQTFHDSGLAISMDVAKKIVVLAEAHSYYVQLLSRTTWDFTTKTVKAEDVDDAYAQVINDQLLFFRSQTDRLTKYQVNYIKALVVGETKMTSSRVTKDYDLGTAPNIKRIETALKDAEIIDYTGDTPAFCEPFFAPLFKKHFMDI